MTTDAHLTAYLDRVGLAAPPPPTADGLSTLHLAHATHVPFENIDVLLGHPIHLDAESLHKKLVLDRRGGYCFEQNALFAGVLARLGFRVTRLAARVRYRATRLLPRTHMLLLVELDDGPRVADVGFGGSGLLVPMRLEAGPEQRQFRWAYRLVREACGWVLQGGRPGGGWDDFYTFTLEPQEPVDYEVANYYVSTHPDSAFTRTLAVQLPTPECRHILRNRELTTDRGDRVEAREVTDDELPELLARVFGLAVPAGTTFPNHPWGWRKE